MSTARAAALSAACQPTTQPAVAAAHPAADASCVPAASRATKPISAALAAAALAPPT